MAKTPRPAVSAILLAAGQSRRMGALNKLLLDVDGMPMVRRTAAALCGSAASEVVVVLGHDDEAVGQALQGLPLRTVVNDRHDDGQMTSVRAGLAALKAPSHGILICLGDQPLLQSADYDGLAQIFRSLSSPAILVPTYLGERANPIVIPFAWRENILSRGLNFGCRNLILDNPDLVHTVAMDNANFVRDFDTPRDYAHLVDDRLRTLPRCC